MGLEYFWLVQPFDSERELLGLNNASATMSRIETEQEDDIELQSISTKPVIDKDFEFSDEEVQGKCYRSL
jgi:hypothetical protein